MEVGDKKARDRERESKKKEELRRPYLWHSATVLDASDSRRERRRREGGGGGKDVEIGG